MIKAVSFVKRQFWPISALLFAPWHASLFLWALSSLSSGTAVGDYIAAHDSALKSILIVGFSLYFMLALMMWVAGKRQPVSEQASSRSQNDPVPGLSAMQIIGWGLVGIVTLPVVMMLSTITQRAHMMTTFQHIFGLDVDMNQGLIWLISIAMLIMIPTMVIWLVWMWRAWMRTDRSQMGVDSWDYEYEG